MHSPGAGYYQVVYTLYEPSSYTLLHVASFRLRRSRHQNVVTEVSLNRITCSRRYAICHLQPDQIPDIGERRT
jgi:hypothetical protein